MKKLIYNLLWMLIIQVAITGCKEDDPELGPPPSASDAEFTFSPSASNKNQIVFTSTGGSGVKKWDFGNGESAEGDVVSTNYIFAGTYEVTLRVYAKGGSIVSTKTIEIEETDLSQLPDEYVFLTGGIDSPEGKTWVVDATRAGHMGVGPIGGSSPDWWAAKADEKAGSGLYDDKHTFKMEGLQYIQETNGDIFVHTDHASAFPGAYSNAGDYTAPYVAPANLKWSYAVTNGKKILTITSPGFIGFYTGASTYEILSISENEMLLKYNDSADGGRAWFLRLIPEGFEPPPPPPPAKSTLPINFEGAVPPFSGFGGSTYAVVNNPSSAGINTSAKVGEYIKGTEGNWAGISTDLSSAIDFSSDALFKYKVYSPVTGKALFKLESTTNAGEPIEVFGNVTKVNEWEELTFDFSGTPSGVYDRIAIFLDFDNNNGGTFYIDDIRQAEQTFELTLADLTGATSKIWKLKPAAGAFGVGPDKGGDAWWPNGENISANRPCLFNDEYIFKTGGVYEYKTNGDIWGEEYMGLNNACADDADIPGDASAWGSGVHSFSFTPATESTPASITVTGTGAFIALPKAKNGAEYSSGPPDANGSVTYEVLSYSRSGSNETLRISVDVGNGFWTFVLTAVN